MKTVKKMEYKTPKSVKIDLDPESMISTSGDGYDSMGNTEDEDPGAKHRFRTTYSEL